MIPCGGSHSYASVAAFLRRYKGSPFLIWMLQYMKDAIRWHLDYRKTILLA